MAACEHSIGGSARQEADCTDVDCTEAGRKVESDSAVLQQAEDMKGVQVVQTDSIMQKDNGIENAEMTQSGSMKEQQISDIKDVQLNQHNENDDTSKVPQEAVLRYSGIAYGCRWNGTCFAKGE